MLLNGIDKLDELTGLAAGRRAAVLTNSAARNRDGLGVLEALAAAGIHPVLLFSPEHGFGADADAGAEVDDSTQGTAALRCISLYGARKNIPAEALELFDMLIADLPDVGIRYYTYASTLFDAIADCAAAGREVIILDRANPLGCGILEGPLLEMRHASIVGRYPVPVRHGMTLGEYAECAHRHFGLAPGVTLRRITAEGLPPDALFPEFGRSWINPSPNLRSFEALTAYSGTCLFEGTNLSEGRGTDAPFLRFGAPWMDAAAILSALPVFPGIKLHEEAFTPDASKFSGEVCRGIRMEISDFREARSFEAVMEILTALRQRHPSEVTFLNEHFDRLLGSSAWREERESTEELLARAKRECQAFQQEFLP